MDRWKEGYNDCNREWQKKIQEKIDRLFYETKYIGDCKNDCEKCFAQYRGANFVYCYAYHQIKVLQDLLKKGERYERNKI